MRAYYALFRQQLLTSLQFRAGFWGNCITHFFWALVRVAVIVAFYTYGQGDPAMDLTQAVAMIWLQEIALNLLPGYSMDYGVWKRVSGGEVCYDLLRPLDLYNHWYVNAAAFKVAPFLLNLAVLTVPALLMPGRFALRLSTPPLTALAGVVTLCTGLMVSCTVICLTYAACMDVHIGPNPASVFMTVSQILAGSLLPLQLWPDFMQGFLRWQPFASMMDLPLRFFVGTASLNELPQILLTQLVWGVVLWRLGRFWISRNLKKLILQGG